MTRQRSQRSRPSADAERRELALALRRLAQRIEELRDTDLTHALAALAAPIRRLAERARHVLGEVAPGSSEARGEPGEDAGSRERPAPPESQRPSARRATAPLEGLQVMIVDDDDDAREAMSTMLTIAGATVMKAASAIEAFDVLQQGRPDVLISDIVMPDADGYALLRRVRAPDTGERGLIPAIAVTGYGSTEDRQHALAAGYQEHLTKPFDPDELIAAVTRLAGRSAP